MYNKSRVDFDSLEQITVKDDSFPSVIALKFLWLAFGVNLKMYLSPLYPLVGNTKSR